MKISQREARRLRKENGELLKQVNEQRRAYAKEWPGGTQILTMTLCESQHAIINTARRLAHGVVVLPAGEGTKVYFYALQLPELS